jgi:hypothetical protein
MMRRLLRVAFFISISIARAFIEHDPTARNFLIAL